MRERFLELLSKEYPDIKSAAVEIINLKAILSLPKGTEYFFSDLHGEHQAFIYMLKSASGVIREKIDWLFGKHTLRERDELATLVCNPEVVLSRKRYEPDFQEWCRANIYKLIEVCRSTSSKYTRSKVRKRLPQGFDYIMDELLHAEDDENKAFYYSEIINSLIDTDMAEEFICTLCETISKMAVDRLHIVGDVFDRGPHPDLIMDYLIRYDNVDFQWGNHDVVWMGAAAGHWSCIANVLRMNVSYNNFDMLEIGYGINLRPLSAFAAEMYGDDNCEFFRPKLFEQNKYDPVDIQLASKMHKAIAIIQFKLDEQLIMRHPEYGMENRLILHTYDPETGTVEIEGKRYELRDKNLPTVIKGHENELTEEEYELMKRLSAAFLSSEKLQRHIKFLFSHGNMYTCFNGNLLYHGCVPMDEDGSFLPLDLTEGTFRGRALYDYLESRVRKAFFVPSSYYDADIMWYMWCGKVSPLFAKNKMTTFERCFIADKATHKETANAYYKFIKEEEVCKKIIGEFGMDPESAHIINGHIPVKSKDGESPVRANGKLFVIDGGMAKSYQGTTGIGGYTLIYNSRYMAIAEHKPYVFDSDDEAAVQPMPKIQKVDYMKDRVMVRDTDDGADLKTRIDDLKLLIEAYKMGIIKERQ